MACHVLTHEISKRIHRSSPVCPRSTSGIGHTRLQKLKEHKQKTSASLSKNAVEKKKKKAKRKVIAKVFALHANAIKI